MEKEYPDEKGAIVMTIAVIVGLLLLGLVVATVKFGLIVAIEAFAMYLIVLFLIAAECMLVVRFVLRRALRSVFWGVITLCATMLFNSIVYVIALVMYIRPWAYVQAGIPISETPDFAFMFLNITGAVVILTAISWSVIKAKQEFISKAVMAT